MDFLKNIFGINEEAQPVDAIRSGKELRERQENLETGVDSVTEELMKQNPELFNNLNTTNSLTNPQPKAFNTFNNFYNELTAPRVGNMGILDLFNAAKTAFNPTPFGIATLGIMGLRNLPKDSFTDKVGIASFGKDYDPYGYKSDLQHGNLGARQDPFGRNFSSFAGNYEQNRIAELKELTQLQNLGLLNNQFKQNKLDFAQNYLEKVRQERERDQINRARENFADVYASADKQGFTGPGGGFSTEQTGKEGAFGTFGEGRGRKDY
jgi:hypothetical protein